MHTEGELLLRCNLCPRSGSSPLFTTGGWYQFLLIANLGSGAIGPDAVPLVVEENRCGSVEL